MSGEVVVGKRRTVLLGGMAMILHGLSWNTKDYDISLDPFPDAQTWAAAIQQLLRREPPLQVQRPAKRPIAIAGAKSTPVARKERAIRVVSRELAGGFVRPVLR